jgi:cytochrome c oxidase cbb3-type subunit 4
MDINLLRGVILLVLIFSFAGLWVWAWSGKRKPAFDEASMLPLEEDLGHVPGYEERSDDSLQTEEGVNHVN